MSDESRNEASNATADREPRVHSGTGGMWLGPMLPAITWAVQMQLNYWLVRGACARGSNTGLHTTFLIAVVLVCIAGLGCWLAWRRLRRVWPSAYRDEDVRNRFLAVLGLLMAGTFLLVIIAQAVATIVFDPCQL